MTTHKKLADQISKRWVIVNDDANDVCLLDESELYTTLDDAKKVFQRSVEYEDIDPQDGWHIREVTLGTKYTLEQEPKWKEVK